MQSEAIEDERPVDLLAREAALRSRTGRLRMREAAEALGVPEAALIEARRATGAATRLRRPEAPEGFGAVIARLPDAGRLMALTRNTSCVHELRGRYAPPRFHGAMGQVVGPIDLRLFLRHWAYGYQLVEEGRDGLRVSLQFFDASGTAIHKVYPTEGTDGDAFCEIVSAFADHEAPAATFVPQRPAEGERPDGTIDVGGLRAAWEGLEHSHGFHGLLGEFGVSRLQAMRLAGPRRARPVEPRAAARLLAAVAESALPIMVFVGNPGCVQIFSGPVRKIEIMGPWVNVLDPDFSLHLRADQVASAWLVRKPSMRGDVHSLELFDARGEVICQVFGHRPPGQPEREDWRACVTQLAGLPL